MTDRRRFQSLTINVPDPSGFEGWPASSTDKTEEPLWALAQSIARDAHEGQTDHAGRDYMEHLQAVAILATRGPTNESHNDGWYAAALLHDTIEDSNWTGFRLREAGVPASVVEVVETLTRTETIGYDAYIRQLALSDRATRIKIADLKHNLSVSRNPAPIDVEYYGEQVKRYARALNYLTGHHDKHPWDTAEEGKGAW